MPPSSGRVTMDAMFGGVSRQPPTLRRPEQVKEAVNSLLTVARGAEKRPGTQRVCRLAGLSLGLSEDASFHWINRDASERYLVVFRNDATTPIQVRNVTTGASYTVGYKTAEAKTYCVGAVGTIKALTIIDTTLILNTSVTVGTLSDADNIGLEFADTGEDLAGIYASPKAFPGSPTAGMYYKADKPHPYSVNKPNLQIDLLGGFYKESTNAREHTLEGGTDFKYEPRWVETEDQLPEKFGAANYTGTPPTMEDPTYWEVKKTSSYGPLGWRKGTLNVTTGLIEYVRFPEPDVAGCYLDPDTLPVKMVRKVATAQDVTDYGVTLASVFFEVQVNDWTPRMNGDDELSPPPSFVGATIQDLTTFRDRLCFASGENLCMSAIDDFFNFWLDDYTDVVDSDRIDVRSTSNTIQRLIHLVPHNGVLVCFAEGGMQFELRSNDQPLGPLTASLVPTTSYDVTEDVKPVSGGKQLFFLTDTDSPATVYEYLLDSAALTPQNFANNITAHVEDYIPEGSSQLCVSEKNTTLAVLNDEYRNRLYIYHYFWVGQEKLQSAWSYYEFPATDYLYSGFIVGDDIYLLVRQMYLSGNYNQNSEASMMVADGQAWHIVKLHLRQLAPVEDLEYFPHLDWNTQVDPDDPPEDWSVTYNSPTDTTIVTVPWVDMSMVYDGTQYQAVMSTGDAPGRSIYPYTWAISTAGQTIVFVFRGRFDGSFVLGRQFDWSLELNPPYLRDARGGVLDTGVTNIDFININYKDSGYFQLEAGSSVIPHSPFTVGGPTSQTNGPQVYSGKFRTMVLAEAGKQTLSLSNDSPSPSNIASIEYEVSYTQR